MGKENETKITKNWNYCYEDKFNLEDLENRRLYLNDVVDNCCIDDIVYNIIRYNRLDKNIPKSERKPIILYINSPGGDVPEGYAVIDAIITSETPVYTVNLGMAASMAFLIFISGHKRYCFPHSEFLMHDGSTGGFDSTAKMRDRIEFETGVLEETTKKFILEKTAIDEKTYDEKYRIEWYFMPDIAEKYGVLDFIVGKNCSINDII